jgi:hypothetical protein
MPSTKLFRARIWDSTEGAVEHTIASSMVSVELFGGQVVRPLQGRTESQPWQLEVLDNDDYFTSKIADSGGRMVLLRRLVDVQASENGGAYATVATGRLTDLQDHVSHYRLTIDDERVLERQSKIWTSLNADIGTTGGLGTGTTAFYAGTYLIPAGVAVATSSEDAGLYGPHSYQFRPQRRATW